MIGQRIKEIRHNNNLTQEELAQGIISRTYLSLIEKGTVQPSTNVLIKLSERLSCSVDDFLNEVSTYEHNDVEILKEISHQEYQLTQRNFDVVETFMKKNVLSVQHLPTEERGRVHAIYGKYYYYNDQFKMANEHLTHALKILEATPIHQNYVDTCIMKIDVETNEKNYANALNELDELYIKVIKFDWNLVDLSRIYFYYVDVYFKLEQLYVANRYYDKYKQLSERLNIGYRQTEAQYLELKLLYKTHALETLYQRVQYDESTIGSLFCAFYYYNQGNIRVAKELFDKLPSENTWMKEDATYQEVHDLLKERLLMI